MHLAAKYRSLNYHELFPMMRRLFDAVVRPTVSYGCEVWGTICSGSLPAEIKRVADIQLTFFRQALHLRRGVSAPVVFAELNEVP